MVFTLMFRLESRIYMAPWLLEKGLTLWMALHGP